MPRRKRSDREGATGVGGAGASGGAFQRMKQELENIQETLRRQKQEAEPKVQEAEGWMKEALRLQKQEAERKVQEAERRMQEALRLQKQETERRVQEALHLHKQEAERSMHEVMRLQKQEAERKVKEAEGRLQEVLRLQEERLCEMDRKLQKKDDAVRTLQQRLQETHVRMTALEERTTAPEVSGGEGLQRLKGIVNEIEASLESALQTFMARVEALFRQLEQPQSSRATVATASASGRQEPASGGAAGGGGKEHPSSTSTPTPSGAGLQGAAADEEQRARQRVEFGVREVYLKMEEARNSPSPLGEQLLVAAKEGRLSVVRRLIDSGADVNFTNQYGSTPLVNADFNAHADVVSLLLQRGAAVNAVNRFGCSALHRAAWRDLSGRRVGLLVRAGADVNMRAVNGETPLHCAACNNNEEAVRALLAAGARRDLKGWGGFFKDRTPFDKTISSRIRNLLRQELS